MIVKVQKKKEKNVWQKTGVGKNQTISFLSRG